jgi:hypothetical protein
MREDMAQVIIDRPRRQSRDRASQLKGKARRYYKETGKILGDFGTKGFNDHTAPLNRWLHKQVGRPWNEVWSEVCQAGDNRNIVNKHLRQHVRGYVSISKKKNGISSPYMSGWPYLWVDDEGILREGQGYRKWKFKPQPSPWVHLSPTEQLTMINGIWYHCKVFRRLVESVEYDPVTQRRAKCRLLTYEQERDVIATYGRMVNEWIGDRKQLSKKELKEYGLKNGQMAQPKSDPE